MLLGSRESRSPSPSGQRRHCDTPRVGERRHSGPSAGQPPPRDAPWVGGALTRSRSPARRPPEPRLWGSRFGDVTWARIAPGGIARIERRRIMSRRARTARGGADCVAPGSHCASRFRRAPVGRDGSGQTGDAVPVGAFGGPAVAAHAGRFFVDGFPLMRSGARTPLRLRPYCDSGAVGFLLRLPHTRSVGPASLRRRGWAGAVWCGWGSQDGPGRGRVQICCKGAPDRDRPRMKARNINDSPPALRRDRGLCNRFGQPAPSRPLRGGRPRVR